MESLSRLASELSIPERTLRRAAAEGLVRGRRLSPRHFHTTLREEMYLYSHWTLLHSLRAALRTEPNVRLAVLFGSAANGVDHDRSDIDVLVVLGDPAMSRMIDLAGRLTRGLSREVQLVRLSDAERSPVLMASVLEEGRVLVDRDKRWPGLQAALPRWQRSASRAERPLAEAIESLERDGSDAP